MYGLIFKNYNVILFSTSLVGDVMMCPCYNNLKTGSAKRELREDVITNKISIIYIIEERGEWMKHIKVFYYYYYTWFY